jgi:hypothetical protein
MMVVVLEDAAEDIESGRRFYESCEAGVGDYFAESILSDLDSLVLYAGIHPVYFGFHRVLSKRSHSDSTMRLKVTWRTFMPSWI